MKCKCVDFEKGLHIFSDHSFHTVERCVNCHQPRDRKKIYIKNPPDWQNLPIFKTYTSEVRCQVRGCGRTDTQKHHVFPRHLFSYWQDSPIVYLCFYHHIQQWHKILTPEMNKKGKKK